MQTIQRRSTLALALVAGIEALGASAPAFAQSPVVHIRGTIERAGAGEIVVMQREGGEVTVMLPGTVRRTAVERASFSDVKPGSYIGAAAMPQADGSQRALSVVVFPEAMRGSGEGFRPWDLLPESTMTNATVAETVGKVDGQMVKLTYKDGEKTLIVSPETPIVGFAPAEAADLKPGARVVVFATKGTDGTYTAGNVVVGKNGVEPPM